MRGKSEEVLLGILSGEARHGDTCLRNVSIEHGTKMVFPFSLMTSLFR